MQAAHDLETLLPIAQGRGPKDAPYAGEVTPKEAYLLLENHPEALLVDVRTPEEWASVGLPEIGNIAELPWRFLGEAEPNPYFLEQLKKLHADAEAPVLFLCKGGGRSFEAANAAALAGYTRAFNVTSGFEGERGWKAEGLPWRKG